MEALLRSFAGCNRFLCNKSLALQKERLDNKKRCLSYSRLCNLLPTWKKEHPFLADAPSQALQQTLKDLGRALSEAFGYVLEAPLFLMHLFLAWLGRGLGWLVKSVVGSGIFFQRYHLCCCFGDENSRYLLDYS